MPVRLRENVAEELEMEKILIVEDDASIQSLFSEFLGKIGFSAEVADNGFEALLKIKAGRPVLMVTDIVMKGMDGLGLIREVRKTSPDMKIIAISGGHHSVDVDFRARAEEVGADRFMQKPIPLKVLRETIEELLGSRFPHQ